MFLDFIVRESVIKYKNNDINFNNFNYYTYSREAIYQICNELEINYTSEVILPDYVCSTVIDTIHEFTKNILYYQINQNIKFDEKEINSLITINTKMILFIDYFGVETIVSTDMINILKSKHIIILKDAAHSFLTLVKNQFRSSYRYDYLVSSIYKNISLHVGALSIGNFKETNKFINYKLYNKRKIILYIKKIICFFGLSRLINKNIDKLTIVSDRYISYNFGKNIMDEYIKKLSIIDYEYIIKERYILSMEFYKYFQSKSLFTKDEILNNSLQAFPIKCSSLEERNIILNIMKKNCIDAYTWATFHPDVINEKLWSTTLLFPINKQVLKVIKDNNINV